MLEKRQIRLPEVGVRTVRVDLPGTIVYVVIIQLQGDDRLTNRDVAGGEAAATGGKDVM